MGTLSQGTKIAAGAAVVLLISTFLEWVHASVSLGPIKASSGSSGFSEYFFGKLVALLAIGVIVLIVLAAKGSLPDLPLPTSMLIAGAGVLSFLFALFHVFSTPGGDVSGVSGVDIGASYGVYVAMLAAAGVAFGGYRMMNE
jgi:hypothetical protein